MNEERPQIPDEFFAEFVFPSQAGECQNAIRTIELEAAKLAVEEVLRDMHIVYRDGTLGLSCFWEPWPEPFYVPICTLDQSVERLFAGSFETPDQEREAKRLFQAFADFVKQSESEP